MVTAYLIGPRQSVMGCCFIEASRDVGLVSQRRRKDPIGASFESAVWSEDLDKDGSMRLWGG